MRLSIGIGFLSAIADRFGYWNADVSAWGNWGSFVNYTGILNPWLTKSMIPSLAIIATVPEIVFGICLIFGFKTNLFAKLSGYLLVLFALS